MMSVTITIALCVLLCVLLLVQQSHAKRSGPVREIDDPHGGRPLNVRSQLSRFSCTSLDGPFCPLFGTPALVEYDLVGHPPLGAAVQDADPDLSKKILNMINSQQKIFKPTTAAAAGGAGQLHLEFQDLNGNPIEPDDVQSETMRNILEQAQEQLDGGGEMTEEWIEQLKAQGFDVQVLDQKQSQDFLQEKFDRQLEEDDGEEEIELELEFDLDDLEGMQEILESGEVEVQLDGETYTVDLADTDLLETLEELLLTASTTQPGTSFAESEEHEEQESASEKQFKAAQQKAVDQAFKTANGIQTPVVTTRHVQSPRGGVNPNRPLKQKQNNVKQLLTPEQQKQREKREADQKVDQLRGNVAPVRQQVQAVDAQGMRITMGEPTSTYRVVEPATPEEIRERHKGYVQDSETKFEEAKAFRGESKQTRGKFVSRHSSASSGAAAQKSQKSTDVPATDDSAKVQNRLKELNNKAKKP